MKPSTIALTLLASSAALVSAHSFVEDLTIDGVKHASYNPITDPLKRPPPARVSWTAPRLRPVSDPSSPAIACALDATPGLLYAPAQPGSSITLKWNTWLSTQAGPVITYMAACTSGDCRDEDATKLGWFKIDEAGLGTDGKWATEKLRAAGGRWTVKVPEGLKGGRYVLRHEVVSLAGAMVKGGADFYVGCFNLEIGGEGAGVPTETVKLPGAYRKEDKGLHINIYYPAPKSYSIPGPPVATITKPAVEIPDTEEEEEEEEESSDSEEEELDEEDDASSDSEEEDDAGQPPVLVAHPDGHEEPGAEDPELEGEHPHPDAEGKDGEHPHPDATHPHPDETHPSQPTATPSSTLAPSTNEFPSFEESPAPAAPSDHPSAESSHVGTTPHPTYPTEDELEELESLYPIPTAPPLDKDYTEEDKKHGLLGWLLRPFLYGKNEKGEDVMYEPCPAGSDNCVNGYRGRTRPNYSTW